MFVRTSTLVEPLVRIVFVLLYCFDFGLNAVLLWFCYWGWNLEPLLEGFGVRFLVWTPYCFDFGIKFNAEARHLFSRNSSRNQLFWYLFSTRAHTANIQIVIFKTYLCWRFSAKFVVNYRFSRNNFRGLAPLRFENAKCSQLVTKFNKQGLKQKFEKLKRWFAEKSIMHIVTSSELCQENLR